ncbi:hypothetical protein [Streptomyces sp. 039-1]|uniref:hypothetical protein n=1 Tax=Streptomyces sp. 039-1 TaxID=2789263 RepID=UPI0039F52371
MQFDFGDTQTITSDELREIFERLQPYLPSQLRTVEPAPCRGLRYDFAPFSGRETEPSRPDASYDDPRLTYVREDADAQEHKLRLVAREILRDVYERLYVLWRDASYVADLKAAVQDAPTRWQAYEREFKATESAYAYLRTPEAGPEWPSAVSRLVDAQERLLAAAVAFAVRAREIALVHEKYLYSDLVPHAALQAAGYPDATGWHIGETCEGRFLDRLTDTVRTAINQQRAHVTQVSQLAGASTS